jgi:arylsulfatase A-like enzyme
MDGHQGWSESRRRFSARARAVAAGAVAAAVLGMAPLAAQQNVLVLLADDLGCDAVGCYGSPSAPPTPNLDALAAGGVRFLGTHTSPTCSPTRGELMTGRYGFRIGVAGALGGTDVGIDPQETLLPTALLGTGRQCALIGKWHLGTRYGNATPNTLGWPHFVGAIDAGIPDFSLWPKVRNGVASTSTRYATTDEVDEALLWIAARTTPWLCVVSFHAPHRPFHAPPPHLHTQNLAGLDPAVTPRPFFVAMVQALDTEIGRLLQGLGAARANTTVVLLGDNGTDGEVVAPPTNPAHAKGSLYQAGTHVPLIVNGPAVVHPGRTSPALVHTVDLFPTLLQLCGAPLPPASSPRPLDGLSMLPLLADTTNALRPHLYLEIRGTPFGGGYALKDGRYELLRFLQTVPQHQELYDLAADPLEQHDLLAGTPSPGAMQQQQRLEALLAAVRSDGWVEGYASGCPGSGGVPTLRAQTMPKLGDWFYVQVQNAPLLAAPLALVAWGDSRTQANGRSLPFDLGPFGMPGCAILQSFQAVMMVSPTTGYAREWVPPAPTLLGAEFFAQAVVAEPGANVPGLIGSRGLRCVVGT